MSRGDRKTRRGRMPASRGVAGGVIVMFAAFAAVLSFTGSARAAVTCEYKASPPTGGSYDAFNVPTPPGTHNVYYSYWNTLSTPYYARRREADGTIKYENHRTSGGDVGLRELLRRRLHGRRAKNPAAELER